MAKPKLELPRAPLIYLPYMSDCSNRRSETFVMEMADSVSRFPGVGLSGARPLRFLRRALVVLAAIVWSLAGPRAMAQAAVPDGVWLVDGRVAVEIFDCSGEMCGRIVWLATPRDPQEQLHLDKNNPDPELRRRPLCGLTILRGLHPDGGDRWRRGWFYNPRDGRTYRVDARLASDDVIIARVYVGWSTFGQNKTLTRVPHATSEGWCP